MKKLMIAAIAAMTVGAGFAACSDVADCVAWDLSMKLKTLAPKKTTCKDACGDKSTIYYLDAASRTLKGYLWACDYDCEGTSDLNIVLWDAKARKAVIALPSSGTDYQTIDSAFADMMVFGKKADKVAVDFAIAGTDAKGDNAIAVSAAAINGKVAKNGYTCYVKSASGYVAGSIAPVISATTTTPGITAGGICGDIVIDDCEDDVTYDVFYTTLCEVCCDWTNWCDATDALTDGDFVPAVGTWSMKYNKKISNSERTMAAIVPAYAL